MSKPKIVWNNCKKIGEIPKSDATKYVVELAARDGVKYINIREWYLRKKDNTWLPSSRGIAVPIVIPIKGEMNTPARTLLSMAEQALKESETFKIEDPENTVWTIPKNKNA